MADPALTFTFEPSDSYFLVRLAGSADFSQTGALQRCFQEIPRRARPPVLLDCSGLVFVSSSVLGAFLLLRQQLLAVGGQLSLVAPGPEILKILRVSGLIAGLNVQPDVEQALASLAEKRTE